MGLGTYTIYTRFGMETRPYDPDPYSANPYDVTPYDDPYFIQRMYNWIAQNNVGYHAYFEYDASDGWHRLVAGQFPKGALEFQTLF